jgi:hypothetical protein
MNERICSQDEHIGILRIMRPHVATSIESLFFGVMNRSFTWWSNLTAIPEMRLNMTEI